MRLRAILVLSAFLTPLLFQLSHAGASEKRLTSDEIVATIQGNTVLGTYDGDPYAQYFDPNGTTIFQLKDGRAFEGDWFVDQASQRYCSYHWARGQKCYEVFGDGDNELLWLEEGTTQHERTTLVNGRKLFDVKPKIVQRPERNK
jgi:hypothetical protein